MEAGDSQSVELKGIKSWKRSSLSSMGGAGCWLLPWYFWRMNVLVRTVVDQVQIANAWFSFPRHDSVHALNLFYPGVVQTRRARAANLALSLLILIFRHTSHSVSFKTWTLYYRVLWCTTINSKKSEKKIKGASLVAQLVNKLPTVHEILVQFLGWEDPLEKGTATHSSILAWRIPWTIQSMGSQRVRYHWATFTFTINKGLDSLRSRF